MTMNDSIKELTALIGDEEKPITITKTQLEQAMTCLYVRNDEFIDDLFKALERLSEGKHK